MRVSSIFIAALLVSRSAFAFGPANGGGMATPQSLVHDIPNANAGQALHDNSCAKYALFVMRGIHEDDDLPVDQLKTFCSTNPSASVCKATIEMIKDDGKSPGGLSCKGAGA